MKLKKTITFLGYIFVIGGILTVLYLSTFSFYSFNKLATSVEKSLYTMSFHLKRDNQRTHSALVLIQTTQSDIKQLGGAGNPAFPDIPLTQYQRLIKKINRAQPHLIYFDFSIGAHPAQYQTFVDHIKDIKPLIIAIPFTFKQSIPSEFSTFPEVYFRAHTTDALDDPMISYLYFSSDNFQLVYDRVLNKLGESPTITDHGLSFKDYLKTLTNNRLGAEGKRKGSLINYVKDHYYTRFAVHQILAPHFDLTKLKDKIVLIGTNTAFSTNDTVINRVLTPFSSKSDDPFIAGASLTYVFTNIVNDFLTDQAITIYPQTVDYTLTGLFCLAILIAWWFLTPLVTIFIYCMGIIALLLINWLLLSFFHVYLPVFVILYFTTMSLAIGAIARLLKENYRRFAAQQKHLILEEIHDLKSNFISLISHNLNTPIAKIRSLMEVLQFDRQNLLVAPAPQVLQQVIKSTVFLERYFFNILQMTKLEEDAFRLNLKSKDINQLVEKKAREFASSLKAKNLQLNTDLPPLFPFRMDETITMTILDNLIDNAIKFAYPGTTIYIETEEEDEAIILSVANHGTPPPETELPLVFDKFFCGTNPENSEEKGMGIGLYICQYLMALQKGTIAIDTLNGDTTIFYLSFSTDL